MKTRNLFSTLTALALSFFATASAENYWMGNDGYECCEATCCEEACCDGKSWISADYLYWKIKDTSKVIPLATEAPTINLALTNPDAKVVLGGKKQNLEWRSGARLAIGTWLDCDRTFGVEAGGFFIPPYWNIHSVATVGLGPNFLGIPYHNAITDLETSFPITGPIAQLPFTGLAYYKIENQMTGAELNGLMDFEFCRPLGIKLIAGFRYLNFQEKFTFRTSEPIRPLSTSVRNTKDRFQTRNNFYGGQIGAAFNYDCSCFTFDLKAKIALGATKGNVGIHGYFKNNTGITSNIPLQFNGGVFALPTNIGNYKKTFFTYIPEANVDIGYKITECIQLKVGYTFLYVSKVLRATKQIDRNLNPTQSPFFNNNPLATLVGTPQPKGSTKTESLWAQGVNIGVEFNF